MDDAKRIEEALKLIENFHSNASTIEELIREIKLVLIPEPVESFLFLYFKESGKWAYEGWGKLPRSAFAYRKPQEFHKIVMQYNDGHWPGISPSSHSYNLVVVSPDEEHPRFQEGGFGFHLFYPAGSFS